MITGKFENHHFTCVRLMACNRRNVDNVAAVPCHHAGSEHARERGNSRHIRLQHRLHVLCTKTGNVENVNLLTQTGNINYVTPLRKIGNVNYVTLQLRA